jgi:hypothetical protein
MVLPRRHKMGFRIQTKNKRKRKGKWDICKGLLASKEDSKFSERAAAQREGRRATVTALASEMKDYRV